MLIMFRLGQWLQTRGPLAQMALLLLVRPIYGVYSAVFVGAELPISVAVGRSLSIKHGSGLVVHKNVSLGDFVTLRNAVTIGVKSSGDAKAPRIGSYVQIGSGAVLVGDIVVGEGATIGALTFVNKDVEPGSVIVASPSRSIERSQ